MPYVVAVRLEGGASQDFGVQDLHGALELARQFLSKGGSEVAIRDDWRSIEISGPDLIRCCNGEKMLTADLQAIWPAEVCILPS